jgi:uncharacterized protein YegP (UPF0339 family)
MPGFYELKSTSSGQASFVLKADNDRVILRSESYTSVAAAEKGIASVRTNSVIADRFEIAIAKDGSPYFNLKGANGEIIGTSQMYKSEAARDKGIESVKTNGPTTTVVRIE